MYTNNINIKLLSLLIVSCFLLFNFGASLTVLGKIKDYDVVTNKNIEVNDYIVHFKEKSIVSFSNRISSVFNTCFSNFNKKITNKFFDNSIQKHKNKLLSIHNNAKKDILNIMGEDTESKKIFSKEFIMLFNGISVKNINIEQVKKIKKLPYVKDVIPNIKISACLHESIPLINADDVWKTNDSYGKNITGRNVTIAILDTGVDYNHADLKDNYIQEGSYDFINNDADPMDDHFEGHGTHCAGIICGKGNESSYQYVGVAPDAKFYSFKILDENGTGDNEAFFAGLEAAIDPNGDLNTSDHVDIISISFGTSKTGSPDDVLSQMADIAVEAGIVVVAAAGNQGPSSNSISSPGCAQKVICVGSSTKDDKVSVSSSRGPVEFDGSYIIKPDLVAPGVNIMSTKIGGGYKSLSGTSMAVPHVTGAAALILQAKSEIKMYPDEVKSILKDSAFDLGLGYSSNDQGAGRLDIAAALNIKKEVIIDAPSEVFEKTSFKVNISDESGEPINVLAILKIPLHLPRIKIGHSLTFKAPTIFRNNKDILVGEIIVYRLFELDENWKEDIIIKNK